MSTRAAIVGASGYTGAELLRLLLSHPGVEVTAVCAQRSAGRRLGEVFPAFRGSADRPIEAFDADAVAAAADVVFTALPHGHSAAVVAALRERGRPVVDLSADFRLRSPVTYGQWYGDGEGHPQEALLESAVYGLPERYREAIAAAELVACPGCYPTSAILPAAPLLAAGLVETAGVVVDSKSGVSGAGRSPGLATHFPEAGEGIRAYKIAGSHRHTPEIEQELGRAADADVRITFSPHLVPMSRGIATSVYLRPTSVAASAEVYAETVRDAYAAEPFVDFIDADEGLPDTAHVRGSNRVQIGVRYDARAQVVVAVSALDNLVKGAAGQAVQCMNLMRGMPETEGLLGAALFP